MGNFIKEIINQFKVKYPIKTLYLQKTISFFIELYKGNF